MKSDDEKINEPNASESESRESAYESYSSFSESRADGYVRPSATPTEGSSATESGAPSGDSGTYSSSYRSYNSGGGYSSYGSYSSSGNPYSGYGSGSYTGYQNHGNSSGYGSNPYSSGGNTATQSKKNYWIIPLAILLCFTMCLGCFFIGLSFVKDTPNTPSGAPGTNGALNGADQKDEGEKSPFLGGGDVKLEQLPADSVYYTIPSVVTATQDTVVEITTETMTTGSYWGQYVTQGAGSGVIIKSYADKGDSGACGSYIITNNHVIAGAFSITVTLRNGVDYAATLVATDPQTDVAVLHVNEANLPTANLGTSQSLVAGQTVVVIGNPLGSLGGSVSSGIVSCTERNIEIEDVVMKLIQTTAAVNPGNSGGAMFDLEGKLVGVVNAKYSDEQIEGIGFAIPIDIASKVAEDLINYGYVKGRPNHGITTYFGYCTYRNVYVNYEGVKVQGVWASEIAVGSDAEKAGMKGYDLINSVIGADGKTYVFSTAAEADAFFDSLSVGDEITVNAYRFTPNSVMYGTTFEREEHSFTFTVTEYAKS